MKPGDIIMHRGYFSASKIKIKMDETINNSKYPPALTQNKYLLQTWQYFEASLMIYAYIKLHIRKTL